MKKKKRRSSRSSKNTCPKIKVPKAWMKAEDKFPLESTMPVGRRKKRKKA